MDHRGGHLQHADKSVIKTLETWKRPSLLTFTFIFYIYEDFSGDRVQLRLLYLDDGLRCAEVVAANYRGGKSYRRPVRDRPITM